MPCIFSESPNPKHLPKSQLYFSLNKLSSNTTINFTMESIICEHFNSLLPIEDVLRCKPEVARRKIRSKYLPHLLKIGFLREPKLLYKKKRR